MTGAAGQPAATTGGAGATAETTGPFTLVPVGFPMVGGQLAFPPSAIAGSDVSPGFMWSGVPPQAKALALVFQDVGISAVKWIVWDIPSSVTMLPEGLSKTAMPAEISGASQLGSLNNQGYAGPARAGAEYEFALWAVDIEKLPDTAGKTTVQILQDILPMHKVALTDPVKVYNNR